MTRHPDELLAAYVDGDLDDADRRAVQTHLRSCERCGREVELATHARRALVALPDVEPPAGTAFRVLREARRPPATGRAWRIATAAGIAASLIAGAVVLVQRVDLGGGAAQTATESGGEAGPAAPAPAEADAAEEATTTRSATLAPRYRASNQRYAPEDMPRVLDRLADEANRLLASDQAASDAALADGTPDRRAAAAMRCSTSAIRGATQIQDPGIPFVFERASFFNVHTGAYVPGYVAAYLGPGPTGDRPGSLFMTVVDRQTCDRLLYYTPPVEL